MLQRANVASLWRPHVIITDYSHTLIAVLDNLENHGISTFINIVVDLL